MKTSSQLRTSPVRLFPRILLLLSLSATLPAVADEWYGGGGGGNYGDYSNGGYSGGGSGSSSSDVYVLPPFVVDGNDPATFDWAGYFNWMYTSGLLTFDTSTTPTQYFDEGTYLNTGTETANWSQAQSDQKVTTVTDLNKIENGNVRAALKSATQTEAFKKQIESVRANTSFDHLNNKLSEAVALAFLNASTTTKTALVYDKVLTSTDNGYMDGRNSVDVSPEVVKEAAKSVNAGDKYIVIAVHDHLSTGNLSDGDTSAAVQFARTGGTTGIVVALCGDTAQVVVAQNVRVDGAAEAEIRVTYYSVPTSAIAPNG